MTREYRHGPTRIGSRIAAVRKAAGLSQREVADSLGVPPRTFSYYESADGDLPSSLIVPLAEILGVGVHELLGIDPSKAGALRRVGRPGPRRMIEQRVEAVREMPRKDQQFVVKFLDQVLEDYQRRRRKRP